MNQPVGGAEGRGHGRLAEQSFPAHAQLWPRGWKGSPDTFVHERYHAVLSKMCLAWIAQASAVFDQVGTGR